jgi:integral membrane sensor domain MASE1
MSLSPKYVRPYQFVSEIRKRLECKLSPYLELSNLATVALLAFSYFFVGKISLRPGALNHAVTAIWLPAGISLAVILLRGHRGWPGIFVGAFLLSVAIIGSISISLLLAAGNTMEVLISAFLVNKFARGIRAFFRTRDVLRFVLFAAMISPALCAASGVGLLCLGGFARFSDFSRLWFAWWIGDMLGILFVAPFVVLLLGHKHHSSGLAEPLETTALIAGLSIVCVLNFGYHSVAWIPANGLLFLCAPFLVWSALRFCPLEAAGATLVMGGFAMWGSVHGLGPFENATGLPLFVGGFMAVGTATTLTIAAASAQQKRETEDALGMHYILTAVRDREIRSLQDTVESLKIELAKHTCHRTVGPSDEVIT